MFHSAREFRSSTRAKRQRTRSSSAAWRFTSAFLRLGGRVLFLGPWPGERPGGQDVARRRDGAATGTGSTHKNPVPVAERNGHVGLRVGGARGSEWDAPDDLRLHSHTSAPSLCRKRATWQSCVWPGPRHNDSSRAGASLGGRTRQTGQFPWTLYGCKCSNLQ